MQLHFWDTNLLFAFFRSYTIDSWYKEGFQGSFARFRSRFQVQQFANKISKVFNNTPGENRNPESMTGTLPLRGIKELNISVLWYKLVLMLFTMKLFGLLFLVGLSGVGAFRIGYEDEANLEGCSCPVDTVDDKLQCCILKKIIYRLRRLGMLVLPTIVL